MNYWRPPTQKETQPEWNALPVQERMLQIARYFADDVKVREVGINRGFWPERFLAVVGLGGGYAWCVAFLTFCYVAARVERLEDVKPTIAKWRKDGRLPKNPASVVSWYEWFKTNNRLIVDRENVKRGMFIGWRNFRNGKPTGTGHGELVTNPKRTPTGIIFSGIGGNTNQAGSRDGDGVYRTERRWVTNEDRRFFAGDLS